MVFGKIYLSYMGRLESGWTYERWNGFDCSQVCVRLFFVVPPDSIEQPAPVPLRLVFSFSLYSAGLKHKNHIPSPLSSYEADFSYPGPCGMRLEHEL